MNRNVILALLVVLLSVHGATAQEDREGADSKPPIDVPEVILRAAKVEVPPRTRLTASEAFLATKRTATIEVRFSTNFPPDAKAAFLYAASLWERLLTSDVT